MPDALMLPIAPEFANAAARQPAAAQEAATQAAAAQAGVAVSRIGQIQATPGLRLHDAQGRTLPALWPAFDHFKG
jgi:hypothetical protein